MQLRPTRGAAAPATGRRPGCCGRACPRCDTKKARDQGPERRRHAGWQRGAGAGRCHRRPGPAPA
jgi:hypothetical protein